MLIRPWRLTGAAVWWALASALITIPVIALIWAIDWRLGLVSLASPYPVDRRPFLALAGIATQVVFLLVSQRQGRRVGHGNVSAGLGDQPIQRLWLVILLSIAQVIISGIVLGLAQHIPALSNGLKNAEKLGGLFFDGSMWMLPGLVLIVILAPLGEELFFRGWLWTGLRKVWSPVAVSCVTGGLWLSLHLGNGLLYPVFLIPAAILFSIIRHVGGSVRASIVAHVINNGFVASIALLQTALQT